MGNLRGLILGVICVGLAMGANARQSNQPRAELAKSLPATPMVSLAKTDRLPDIIAGAKVPVVLDFGATWCRPCQKLKNAMHEAASTLGDKVMVVQIDIDQHKRLVEKYGVTAIPTLIFLRNGRETGRTEGLQSAASIIAAVNRPIQPQVEFAENPAAPESNGWYRWTAETGKVVFTSYKP